MSWLSELLCADLKRSIASMLPWDIPWHDTSHVVFFAALYGSLAIIGVGLLAAIIITLVHMRHEDEEEHH